MELFCCEADSLKRAFEDPNLVKDNRVLQNLLAIEERYQPSANYFKCVQTDIKPYMRGIVSQWMIEVCEELKCEEEVFPLSMNYLDRFLCVQEIRRGQLQLLGAACMFISSKLMQTTPLTAEKLIFFTDYSITVDELMSMELYVLTCLKWDLMAVTPHDFVDLILNRLPIDKHRSVRIKKHAQTFIALCSTDYKFMIYTPSMIAAGCVGAAAQGLQKSNGHVDLKLLEKLHAITHIEVDCLRACQDQIEQTVASNLSNVANQSADISLKSETMKEQPTTPTDVKDINF